MEATDHPPAAEPVDQVKAASPVITLALMLCSAAGTVLWAAFPDEANLLHAADVELWRGMKWWGLFTSAFLHVDVLHVGMNGYWLWHLGRVLEQKVPRATYATLILLAILLASLAEFAVSGQTGVGMSGLVYGLFGFMLVGRARHVAFRRALPASTIRLFFGWLLLCFALTYSGVLPVANFAHLGGLIAGVLLGFAADQWRFGKAALAALCLLLLGSAVPLFWAPWHDNWHYARAQTALEKNDFPQALLSLEYYHQRHLENTWVAQAAANIRIQQKEYGMALQMLTETMNSAHEHDPVISNNLAWLLATCPEDQVRNGPQAVEIARKICESTDWENASCLDTLAAAYAESGDFDQALKWSAKAVELSQGAEREELQKNYQTFQSKQPLREP